MSSLPGTPFEDFRQAPGETSALSGTTLARRDGVQANGRHHPK